MTKTTEIFAICAVLAGCAATPPTQELQTARQMMWEARSSATEDLNPDGLRKAQNALERAEQAHDDEPGSAEERDLSYVAQRRIAIANTEARIMRQRQQVEQNEELYEDQLENVNEQRATRLEQTRRELESVRSSLHEQGDELNETTQELRQREEELVAREAALAAETQARVDAQQEAEEAEQRYQQAMAQLNELAQVRQEATETIITLSGSVLFATGESELLDSAERRLETVAQALRQDPGSQIVVEGHTDSRGSDGYNDRLSQARADAVRSFLTSHGLESNRVSAVGRGEDEPIASNDSAEGRANNRRVEIIVREGDNRISQLK